MWIIIIGRLELLNVKVVILNALHVIMPIPALLVNLIPKDLIYPKTVNVSQDTSKILQEFAKV